LGYHQCHLWPYSQFHTCFRVYVITFYVYVFMCENKDDDEIKIKRATSSTVHTAALLRVNLMTSSILAGPLKRRLAGLICIVHPTGCTTDCTAGCKV